MRLTYHLMMFMLLVALVFQVAVMRVEIDDVFDMAENTRNLVALTYMEPSKPVSKIKRFEPSPMEVCPWMLEEPVPRDPLPLDMF